METVMVMILNIHLCKNYIECETLLMVSQKLSHIIYMDKCSNPFKNNILCSKKKEQKGIGDTYERRNYGN